MVFQHTLKCWPEFFNAIWEGRKTFDIRNGNDREYKVGDGIMMVEWDREKNQPTCRSFVVEVVYVMHGPPFLPVDTWALGIRKAVS